MLQRSLRVELRSRAEVGYHDKFDEFVFVLPNLHKYADASEFAFATHSGVNVRYATTAVSESMNRIQT